MFWCCCGGTPVPTCIICEACSTTSDGTYSIINDNHPDYLLPGFTSLGRVVGQFALNPASATFSVVFDYVDSLNYKKLLFARGGASDEIDVTLSNISGGGSTTLDTDTLIVTTNSGEATLCMQFGDLYTHHVRASITIGASGDTYTIADSPPDVNFHLNNGSFVGYNGSGSITDYYLAPWEYLAGNGCNSCEYPNSPAHTFCDCCPSGMAESWAVDLSDYYIYDEHSPMCDQLNGIYILDGNGFCLADYELFHVSSVDCGGGIYNNTRFYIWLEIEHPGGVPVAPSGCYMSLNISVNTPPPFGGISCQPLFDSVVESVYIKNTQYFYDLCNGTHILDLDNTAGLGSGGGGYTCQSGTPGVPATVTVQSL